MMNTELKERVKTLTDVDFERDSAVSEQAQLHSLLTQFMENEARSCSMDFGCVDAKYVQNMLGGKYSLEDIEAALKIAKKDLGFK